MSAYSEAVEKAKAARGNIPAQTGDVTGTEGGLVIEGDEDRARTFSQIIAEESEIPANDLPAHDPGKDPLRADNGITKRDLKEHDAETAKTPFLYDVNALGSLRPDQVPRFFGALTDSDKLPDASVPMDSLVAMQDRIDPQKVAAIRAARAAGTDSGASKKPVVVQHNGRNYIADGHHRAAADWLDGKETIDVKVKDLTDKSNALKTLRPSMKKTGRNQFEIYAPVQKVDSDLGLVFGWAIICKEDDGSEYYDAHGDHIPEDAMLEAAADFMANSRMAKEMHDGESRGEYVFCWPMTGEIAKAMGFETKKTGLMVGLKPDRAMLAKFKSGELKAFSIGGNRIVDEVVES